MKFSISFGPVLQELDFYDRIPAAAEIGYDAIEFNPNGADLERVAKLASDNRLRISACCGYNPKVDHLCSDRAVERISESIRRLSAVGVEQLILLTGDRASRQDSQKLLIVENLRRLRDAAEKHRVRLLIEPLNSIMDCRATIWTPCRRRWKLPPSWTVHTYRRCTTFTTCRSWRETSWPRWAGISAVSVTSIWRACPAGTSPAAAS